MKQIISYITAFFLVIGSTTLNAQCPATIASLGQGNGLQICWPRNEAPATLTQIIYDGVTYTGSFVNGGQGDCWRTDQAATIGVNGNHQLEFIVDGDSYDCDYEDGSFSEPMPVELVYFNATADDNEVWVQWQTLSEENNDHFEVERSLDGINFEVVEQIKGAGTTNEVQFYDLVDVLEVLESDMMYYRLKQVDTDGTTSYSEIQAVRIEYKKASGDVTVFPNPAVDRLNLSFDLETASEVIATVYDVTGKVVSQQQFSELGVGTVRKSIDIENIDHGYYILEIRTNSTTKAVKFVKS
ncbi:MAG: T9SS type A sorting domain-containing protein [Aureispira sp.]|nr:T9SS type A sorting domain-containing protein [Aureispira sp.]